MSFANNAAAQKWLPVLLVFFAGTGTLSAQQITPTNWQNHPLIVEVRKIFNEVESKLQRGGLTGGDTVFVHDPDGQIVSYVQYAERDLMTYWTRKSTLELQDSDGNSWIVTDYYDLQPGILTEENKLRFIFAQVQAPNNTHVEYRVYFDADGSQIWEDRRLVSGKPDTLPKTLPDYLVEDQRIALHSQDRLQAGE